MSDLVKDKATICIINYKTLDFTKLCLRSIRKFTHFPYEVIVVDNNSGDESLEYLRSLDWIRLIERDTSNDVSGGHAHSAGLDLGLENCNTEFFISMHSDTFVIKDGWLGDLIAPMTSDRDIVCLGTGKIELTPKWQILVKNATDFKTFRRKLLRTPDPLGKYRYYNRTICAIYRTDIMKELNLSFQADREKGQTSGKKLYFDFIDKGYKTIELPSAVFGKYLIHLAHATQVVNPSEFTLRGKTVRKCNRLVKKIMSSGIIKSIIEDGSLDK